MNNSVWVVTHINDFGLISQYAYADHEKAKAKEEEMHKKLYEHLFLTHREQFEENETFMQFQASEPWWDEDCRTSVYLNETNIE